MHALSPSKPLKEIMGDDKLDKKTTIIWLESESVDVPAYSEVYGCHPRFLMSTSQGMVRVPSSVDAYTSKCADVMRARRLKHNRCESAHVRAHYDKIFGALRARDRHF